MSEKVNLEAIALSKGSFISQYCPDFQAPLKIS